MKTTTKKIDNYQSEITVEYDAADLEKAKNRACKKISEKTNIPGFRKGKIPPVWVIEQHLGKGSVLEEAAELLIQQAADHIVNNDNIIPVTTMKHNILNCKDGEPFTFTLTFTPYPTVKLGDYKNLNIPLNVESVSDTDVDEQLNILRQHHADLVDSPNATVSNGDFITLDFTGAVNNQPFDGGSAKDYPLEIGSHKFIDTFEQQLVGAKIDVPLTINVTFPDDYAVKDLAGKIATFDCTVKSIKKKILPPLDDTFAKKASNFETLDDFKADIKKNMQAAAERRAIEKQADDAIETAANNMIVDIPPVMVEDKITQLVNELDVNLQSRGMTLAQYLAISGTDLTALRDSYRDTAQKAVRTDILLDEVATAENVTVDNRELNIELQYMATIYRASPKQILKVLQENRQISNLVANVRRRKTMKLIADSIAGKNAEPAE